MRQRAIPRELDDAARGAAIRVGHGEDERARTRDSTSAPVHIAHGSWVVKIVTSERRRSPSLRAVAWRVSITACAVGSPEDRPIVVARDHRVVDDGDGADRLLALLAPRRASAIASAM
jgi:hypothetical protein